MKASDAVDMHSHSTCSDGTVRPAEVVRLAVNRGIAGVALTDHDTVEGVAEAEAAAREAGVGFLAGIEVSCEFPRPGTLHMLGYGVDPADEPLRQLVGELEGQREERVELILGALKRSGVAVEWGEVIEAAGEAGVVGRPHVAEVLVRKGYVASRREAFDRYLGGGGVAYVDTNRVSAARAIEVIRCAGGMAALAHPVQLRRERFEQLDAMVRELAAQGMEGLEVIHPSHPDEVVRRLLRLADREGLLPVGGSDFHGEGRSGGRLGNPARPVPGQWWEDVAERVSARGASNASDKRPASRRR